MLHAISFLYGFKNQSSSFHRHTHFGHLRRLFILDSISIQSRVGLPLQKGEMADTGSSGDDGWHQARPANEIREEEQIEQWERSKGHWSGIGKHPTNFSDYKKLHLSQDKELGSGSYGTVERVTYGSVTLARKQYEASSILQCI